MKKINVFLLFLALSSTSLASAQTICSDANLANLVNTGNHAFSENELTNSLKNSEIIIAGEIHFYTDLKPRLDLIKHFQKTAVGKKCVAYEFAAREYDFIEFMDRIKKNIEATKDPNFFAANPQIKPGDVQKLVSAFEQIYNYYWPMADLTRNLGMKAIMVDNKGHTFTSEKTMDERNSAMAENLSISIKNGDCDSILFFVGKAHLSKQPDSTTKVQELVKGLIAKVTTVNLQMTKETFPYGIRSWSICPSSQAVKPSDYAFIKNSELARDYALFPSMLNDTTKWKDFDYTLLVP